MKLNRFNQGVVASALLDEPEDVFLVNGDKNEDDDEDEDDEDEDEDDDDYDDDILIDPDEE